MKRIAFITVLAIAFIGIHRGAHAQSDKPNFVVLFADDLGWGDLSCYGHPLIQTPRLDAMAAGGLRMTSFYAAYACSPARAMLMTGRYPTRNGLYSVLGPDSDGGIPPEEITLAEAVKSAGYATGMFGKWHLGSAKPEHRPLANGFDEYFGLLYSNDMIPPWVKTEKPLHLWEGDAPTDEHPVVQETLTERYTERAVDFIRRHRDEPFFLYLPYAMPHLPIAASENFRGTSAAGLYGDVIETIDWSAGRILDTLEELGLDDNTMVIFTSDNGPWQNLPDRMLAGGVEAWHVGLTGPFRGSKGMTYEGGVRVPGIVRWPGVVPAGSTSRDMASVLDIYTTIAALSGATIPNDYALDGFDITEHLQGNTASPRQEIAHFRGATPEAIRQGPWKLRQEKGEPIQLFHLERDPAERLNVAEEYPERVEAMQRLLSELKQ